MLGLLPEGLQQEVRDGTLVAIFDGEREAVNRLLLDNFPFAGSWPDWMRVRNHRSELAQHSVDLPDVFSRFFDACLADRGTDLAYFANDGLPLALKGAVSTFGAHAESVANISHTSYLLAADGSWCLTLRMSGEMDFGEAPNR